MPSFEDFERITRERDKLLDIVRNKNGEIESGHAEMERLHNANDTLALTLAEAIGALTPDGGGCSRGWIPASTVDRWRRALHEAEEARRG